MAQADTASRVAIHRAGAHPARETHPASRALLYCGAVASVLWIATDIVASLLYDGYSYRDQTISELAAVGAPTRAAVVSLVLAYSVLMLAFAAGISASSAGNRRLRVIAALLALNAAANLVLTPFSSMHQREVLAAGGGTLSDTLHLMVAGSNIVTFLVVMAIGSTVLGRCFRAYSVATITVMLVFGALTGLHGADVSNNEATPWMGVTERISAYAWMIWVAVLAIALADGVGIRFDKASSDGWQQLLGRRR
jgi:hypothetical protein